MDNSFKYNIFSFISLVAEINNQTKLLTSALVCIYLFKRDYTLEMKVKFVSRTE